MTAPATVLVVVDEVRLFASVRSVLCVVVVEEL